MSELKYSQRGVSASKDEVHKAIQNLDKGLYPSAFCKILPDVTGGQSSWCNIMHADTAGTKPILAYLAWKETGNLKYWKNIAQDALVMNLDDMGCVGCTTNIIISSTIGRNRNLIPGEVLQAIIEGTTEFMDKLSDYGVKLYHSGGETADVGDVVRTVDVGFTTFGRIEKDKLLINNIKRGDLIIGLSSEGQSKYEDNYNSGIGSNGLTSARHDILDRSYGQRFPESFDPNIPEDVCYTGSKKLTEEVEVDGKVISVADLLLSPTRTYLPIIKRLLTEMSAGIHGLIHCTGGGQTKVLHYVKSKHIVKDNLFDPPYIFKLIQSESNTNWREMYKVFNMGHRLEIYCHPEVAENILSMASGFNIAARIIGSVEDSENNASSLIINSEYGDHTYQLDEKD